jgi:hypothetical protein
MKEKVGLPLAMAAVVISLIGIAIDAVKSPNHGAVFVLPLIVGMVSILSYRIRRLEKRLDQVERLTE